MSSGGPVGPWQAFTEDPRRSETARLRAANRDRNVVLEVLAEAYADGRLTKEEHDERAARTVQAKTLGELPALIEDLVPARASARELALAAQEDLRRQALARWQNRRAQALIWFLVSSLICWGVWLGTSWDDGEWEPQFLWPLFVSLGTAVPLLRLLLTRRSVIAEEQQRLERRRRRAEGG